MSIGEDHIIQAAYVTMPVATRIAAIAVTDTSAATDMSATNQLGTYLKKGRMVTLVADGNDIFFAAGTTDPAAISDTNTTAGNAARCWVLKDGQPQSFVYNGEKFWELKCASTETATLRAYVSSRNPNESS